MINYFHLSLTKKSNYTCWLLKPVKANKKTRLGISRQIFTIYRPVRSHAWSMRHVNGSPALLSLFQPLHIMTWCRTAAPLQPGCLLAHTWCVEPQDRDHDLVLHRSRISFGCAQRSGGCLLCTSSSSVACHTGPQKSVLKHEWSGFNPCEQTQIYWEDNTLKGSGSIKHLSISLPSAKWAIKFIMTYILGKNRSCSWHFMNRREAVFINIFSAGNYLFRSPFYC